MVVGIVAEYNPFHNGHKLQIDYAKNVLGASQVIIAMSGSFTQRGEIACYDKYTRANAALVSGADIILEIPTVFATSSAREFASAAVELLNSTGIVDTLLFSGESDNLDLFMSAAIALADVESREEFDYEIRTSMSAGLTFAEARAKAFSFHVPAEILKSPNNILGLEYCHYIYTHKLKMNVEVMKRVDNNYNQTKLSGDISSASAIRANYVQNKCLVAVPKKTEAIYSKSTFIDCDDISQMLHYKLISDDDFVKYSDCSRELNDRIKNNIKNYISFNQFCDLLKTKNITHSRISRVLCHILLGITTKDFEEAKSNNYITYSRMLGFSQNGSQILADIKKNGSVPLITEPNNLINKFDIISSDILRAVVTDKTNKGYANEYTRRFNLININDETV